MPRIPQLNGHEHFFFNDYLLFLSPFSCANPQCIPMYRANSSLIMLVMAFTGLSLFANLVQYPQCVS